MDDITDEDMDAVLHDIRLKNVDKDERVCSVCNKLVEREHMSFTRDCHGITYRLVCNPCYERIMLDGPGYDGEYYDESDEQIEPDY